MITEYKAELAVVDEEWLRFVGTAIAVSHYEKECLTILKKIESAKRATAQIETLLNQETDPDESLQIHLDILSSGHVNKLEGLLQVAENRLFAVNQYGWVDEFPMKTAVREHLLKGLGNPRLIKKEEYEDGWQKNEA
jgi:hypothetical protein